MKLSSPTIIIPHEAAIMWSGLYNLRLPRKVDNFKGIVGAFMNQTFYFVLQVGRKLILGCLNYSLSNY